MFCKASQSVFRSRNFPYKLHPRSYNLICSVLSNPVVGSPTEIKGWVKNIRLQKELIFADVSDGSSSERLQVVITKQLRPSSLTYGSSVKISGILATGPRGQVELVADKVDLVGECVMAEGYPFIPRTPHPPEYTRQFLHLRPRTNYISSILRIRNSMTLFIHKFFQSRNFLNINTPILTSNDCEGAGDVFKVLPENELVLKAMIQEGDSNDTAYFKSKTFLSVSGQLHLEAMCRSLGNVYTLGPTFRAENSRSRLHLSEFYMLEAELAFCSDIYELQSIIEDFVKNISYQLQNENNSDLLTINKKWSPPAWLNKQFATLTHEDAYNILEKKGFSIPKGEHFNKEQELTLVNHCNGPVFVVKWPKDMKSFYMKECEEDNTMVDALDLLAPTCGEIVGGSLREDCYEKLKMKLPSDRLEWYLDLRKFGNIPTGGFGLGFERLIQVLCGVSNIKDTIPFPRWPHNCDM